MTDWKLKAKAFLYTPPDAVLIPKNRLEERRKELFKLAFPTDKDIPSKLAKAESMAWALERPTELEEVEVDFAKRPKMKHPLSGKEMTLWEQTAGDVGKEAKETVNKAIEDLRNNYSNDEKFFLALWRLLPAELRKGGSIGGNWEIMPVDPCLPDSVWGHAAATSAIASALPQPAFLLFTISSVQDYISEARRTQDLWMGSFLLSHLMWKAIRAIVEEYGPDVIIYPELRGQPSVDLWLKEKGLEVEEPGEMLKVANFPNFVTAILPEDKAASAAKDACDAVKGTYKEISNKVKGYLEKAARLAKVNDKSLSSTLKMLAQDGKWEAIWERQREDFLSSEIYWVVCPWGKDPKKVLQAAQKYFPQEKPGWFKYLKEKCEEDRAHVGLVYHLLSGRTGKLLEARKELRHFQQSGKEGEPGFKCSLCGKREALHPEWWRKDRKNHYPELRDFWRALSKIKGKKGEERGKLAGRIRRGDRLCSVCATKRLALEAHFAESLGFDRHMFPSTSTVATARFQRDVLENISQLHQEAMDFVEKAKDVLSDILYPSSSLPKLRAMANKKSPDPLLRKFLRIDGEWFFEDSFDEDSIFREYNMRIHQHKLDEVKEKLKGLLKACDDLGIRAPSRYYALISMDVDHLGDWIAGKNNLKFREVVHPDALNALPDELKEVPRPMGPGTQAALRRAIANFALEITHPVVEKEHLGKLIYAGGDDILALAPLSEVDDILEEVHEGFVSDFGKDGLLPGSRATISAGVVLAHRSQPLSQVVEEGREALKEHAKGKLGRDAISFHLMRRSGEFTEVDMGWHLGDSSSLKTLAYMIERFREGWLSPRLARDMGLEAEGIWAMSASSTQPRLTWLTERHIREAAPDHERERIAEKMRGLFVDGYDEFVKDVNRKRKEVGKEQLEERNFNPWELTKRFLLLAHFMSEEP